MAPVPLLSTKLHLPPPRQGLVSRARLMDRLNQGANARLTLVSAPAGFGKTTLIAEWIAACARPVGWLSLDEEDNDPLRFWSYFAGAFREVSPDANAEALDISHFSPSEDTQTTLIYFLNAVADLPHPVTIILDDYHVIENRLIHDAVAYLIDHLPANMHLLVATRADPPWPLAHWRSRSQLVELRTADLRFSPEEAADFFNSTSQLDVPEEDVLALEKRTEGWIAGLQMVALSLQGQKDPRKFVARFTGSNRYIFDYLLEEVLAQQPPEIRDFLLKTSVLEQMTAPLCEALTGNPASQAILMRLERANLFIIPLDDDRRWYRYHHLFMDLLRNQLKQDLPGEVDELYQRASSWYQEHRFIAEALRYALAAKDTERVARMVAQNAFIMVESGELDVVIQWMSTLPPSAFEANPWLSLAYAWALALQGEFEKVEACLEIAEKEAAHGRDQAEGQHIAGHVAILRSFRDAIHGGLPRSTELTKQGLALLPDTDVGARGFANSILSNCLMLTGDLEPAIEYLLKAIALNRDAGNTFVVVDGLGDLAREYILLGKLNLAASACEDAFQYADEIAHTEGRRPVLGFVSGIMGEICRERNDIDSALRFTRDGVALCRQSGQVINQLHCLRYQVQAYLSAGDLAAASQLLKQMRIANKATSSWKQLITTMWEALIHLQMGDLDWLRDWAATCGLSSQDKPTLYGAFYYLNYARILAALGNAKDALGLLESLQEIVEPAGYNGRVIEILALRARIGYQQGDKNLALTLLKKSLSLAAPEGYVRVFIKEGEPLRILLNALVGTADIGEYVLHLLCEFEKEDIRLRKDATAAETPAPTPSPHPRAQTSLVEPLTDRELEVLHLLRTSLNTIEIAAELVISVTTVRTHIKNIYSKLDVNRRMEAVERAVELNLF